MSGAHEDKMRSRVGVHTRLEGELRFKRSLLVEGSYKGDIIGGDEVTVALGAQCDGTITADTVKIYGLVTGNIRALRVLEINSGAVVRGSIQAQELSISDGAQFEGQCAMLDAMDESVVDQGVDKPANVNERAHQAATRA